MKRNVNVKEQFFNCFKLWIENPYSKNLLFTFSPKDQRELLLSGIQVKKQSQPLGLVFISNNPELLNGQSIRVKLGGKDQRLLKLMHWEGLHIQDLEGGSNLLDFDMNTKEFFFTLSADLFMQQHIKVSIPNRALKLRYKIQGEYSFYKDLSVEDENQYVFNREEGENHMLFESPGTYHLSNAKNGSIQLIDKNTYQNQVLLQRMPLPSVNEIIEEENELVGQITLNI